MLQGNWEQYGDQENSFRLDMGARGEPGSEGKPSGTRVVWNLFPISLIAIR